MLKQVAWIPLPILVAIIAILNASLPSVLPSGMVFDSPLLISILNTIFISGSALFAAYVAAKAYSKTGILPLALLGASMLALGLGGLIGSWARDLPDGANLAATIGNVRSLLSSIFAMLCITSTMLGLTSERTGKKLRLHVTILYAAVTSFLILLTITAIQGVTPDFFVKGVGYTPLRQTVVQTSILLFAASSFLMIISYFKSKAKFMYWGAVGFALTAAGVYALFFQRIAGDPISWISRISQYVGCIWILIGLLPSRGAGAKEERYVPSPEIDRAITVKHTPNQPRTIVNSAESDI